MSFKLVLLAAGSLAMAAGAQAQTPEPPTRPEPLRMRRLPSGEMRFSIPRMSMRVAPRIRFDAGALRLRTQERAFQRMDQVRERQFALQDRALTRRLEVQDRARARALELQQRVRNRQLDLQDRLFTRRLERENRVRRPQLDVFDRSMSRMREGMSQLFLRRPLVIRRHSRTI